jgi:hypothetical protein
LILARFYHFFPYLSSKLRLPPGIAKRWFN